MGFSSKRFFLVGMMGSGKSYFARLWSNQVGFPFFDTDHMIEEKSGRTISEIFAENGGGASFRQLEADLIRQAQWPAACFVACGGGLPCYHSNMDYLLQLGRVVWIKPPLEELATRLWNEKSHRPLVAAMPGIVDLENRLEELLSMREPIYKMAHLILNEPPEDFHLLNT